jgi:hypothetical protein
LDVANKGYDFVLTVRDSSTAQRRNEIIVTTLLMQVFLDNPMHGRSSFNSVVAHP